MNNESVKFNIDLSSSECVKKLIQETENGMYSSVSNDGEKVVVYIEQYTGMEVHFYQKNGWIRVDDYDENGFKTGETFSGRWNKNI